MGPGRKYTWTLSDLCLGVEYKYPFLINITQEMMMLSSGWSFAAVELPGDCYLPPLTSAKFQNKQDTLGLHLCATLCRNNLVIFFSGHFLLFFLRFLLMIGRWHNTVFSHFWQSVHGKPSSSFCPGVENRSGGSSPLLLSSGKSLGTWISLSLCLAGLFWGLSELIFIQHWMRSGPEWVLNWCQTLLLAIIDRACCQRYILLK